MQALGLAVGIPLSVALMAALGVRASPSLALVNESDSLPKGIYWRSPGGSAVEGAVVAVAQPSPARGYLAGLGLPRDVLLIKRVAATAGDRVCREDGGVRVAGAWVGVPERDRQGRRLPVWRDCRRLRGGELFLLGDTQTSFDSRYFGPVRREDVVGIYRAGLTW